MSKTITTDLQHIGMLRQWLNEKPKDMMVTNESIVAWLDMGATEQGEEEYDWVDVICEHCRKIWRVNHVKDNCSVTMRYMDSPKPTESKRIEKLERNVGEEVWTTITRVYDKVDEIIDRLEGR